MRTMLLSSAMLMVASLAQAAVITEAGSLQSGRLTENGYLAIYAFAPLAIPGQITGIQLTFAGLISASVGGAADISIAGGNTITSVVITPHAGFVALPFSAPTVPLEQSTSASFTGLPTARPYDNVNNLSVPIALQPVTFTSNVLGNYPSDTFATALLTGVSFFAERGMVSEPPGSRAGLFPDNSDRSSGSGQATLAVTFTPVPEPASLALLAVGLLGILGLQRRRSA